MEWTRAWVKKKVAETFDELERVKVLRLLDSLQLDAVDDMAPEEHEALLCRVRLGVLKLADGDLAKLREQVAVAEQDPQAVVAPAEFPGRLAASSQPLSPERAMDVEASDLRQWNEWLGEPPKGDEMDESQAPILHADMFADVRFLGGLGFLVPVIGVGVLLLAEWISEGASGDERYFQDHAWVAALALVLVAPVLWLVGRKLNVRNGRHSFAFIPLQLWGPIAVGVAITRFFIRL